ncbi:lipopolysaccharide-induced tumor necrosis factor-alpha factor homolog [Brevipalpus obovatus]|uniref:lipopolysaccharide-induced tumor necrosis factor-alpha factor homolog n=1 Tax=Brevipalpus obovatus TaxID=246614 RepID=UPI003D9E1364
MSFNKDSLPSAPPMMPMPEPPPPYSTSDQYYPSLPPQVPQAKSYPVQQGLPPTMNSQPQPQTQVVHQTQVAAAASQANYGPFPVFVQCPGCSNSINTRTSHTTGLVTWLSCLCCCIMGCLVCWCLPFCMDCTRDVEHRCPHCNRKLGIHKRL